MDNIWEKMSDLEIMILESFEAKVGYRLSIDEISKKNSGFMQEPDAYYLASKVEAMGLLKKELNSKSVYSLTAKGKAALEGLKKEREKSKKKKEEQSDFFTSTTKKNKIQIRYLKIGLGILLIDFIYRYLILLRDYIL